MSLQTLPTQRIGMPHRANRRRLRQRREAIFHVELVVPFECPYERITILLHERSHRLVGVVVLDGENRNVELIEVDRFKYLELRAFRIDRAIVDLRESGLAEQ